MSQAESDLEAAETLKREVIEAPGPNKAWPRVTTVLDTFGEHSLSEDVRERISQALEGAGLRAEPPFTEIESRRGTVCLTAADSNGSAPSGSALRVTRITDEEWRAADATAQRGEGVLWIDVDVLAADRESLQRELSAICPELDEEIVTDLYLSDALPKVHSYPSGPRAVSAVALEAREIEEDGPTGFTGQLILRLVEIVSTEGALVTCWHRERIFTAAQEEIGTGEIPVAERDEVRDRLEGRWRDRASDGGHPTSGELGMLLIEEVASTYPSARAELSAWLDSWELDFYRRTTHEEAEPGKGAHTTLINMRAMAAEFKRSVAPLDAPRNRMGTYWFDGVTDEDTARQIDDTVESTVRELDHLSERIRSAFDLVNLSLSQAQDKNGKRLQDRIEMITTFLVVPALVTAFFGANTWLPGGNDVNAHVSFVLMIGAMILGVGGTWWYLRSKRRG